MGPPVLMPVGLAVALLGGAAVAPLVGLAARTGSPAAPRPRRDLSTGRHPRSRTGRRSAAGGHVG
ncbi:hypothetical protein ACFC09_39185 [Streptomyces sp. NPDC056161]|uniref:hypothetical protein n=1 Tax=Streptomyces sp. NPDC056161 TaxID=3345732 RepID=UPI0035DAF87F